ncbi:MAG: hypothetical protein IJ500_03815 [Alphaproteobacteria bacterium]|nr:hypothetical protein [Alphaproteobacteria bacterium]
MFDDVVIVQSAVSAFNNAALAAPAFLWWGILSVPLMAIVWKFAPMINKMLGINENNIAARGGVGVAAMTFLWVVLFGGNYAVLRDGVSVLPFVVATIVFLTSLFVSSHLRDLPTGGLNRRAKIGLVALIIVMLGLSDLHAWWGPLLQVGAFAFGAILGRLARVSMRPVAGIVLIVFLVSVAMLMQPEFFRFGQLGNLTLAHLLFLMVVGVSGMAVIALNNVNPLGKIRHSAYIKLKWMMRFVALLMMALFVLTESVPLFIAMCGAMLILFMMSVWHAKSIPNKLMEMCLAVMIVAFGVITTMPAVSAIGLLCWAMIPRTNFWREIRGLL